MKRSIQAAVLGATILGALAFAGTPSAAEDMPLTAAPAPESSAGGETAYDAAVRVVLERLSVTQSPDKIAAILQSDRPTESLYDPTTNTYLAARIADPLPNLFAITPRGPGCATTDACATGETSYGYYGTGQLNIGLSGITKIFSGDAQTT